MADEEPILVDGKTLNELRVVDLKKELDARHLSKSGSKQQLIARLKAQLLLEKLQNSPVDPTNKVPNSELENEVSGQSSFIKEYLARQQRAMDMQFEEKKKIEEEKQRKSADESESTGDDDNHDKNDNIEKEENASSPEVDTSTVQEVTYAHEALAGKKNTPDPIIDEGDEMARRRKQITAVAAKDNNSDVENNPKKGVKDTNGENKTEKPTSTKEVQEEKEISPPPQRSSRSRRKLNDDHVTRQKLKEPDEKKTEDVEKKAEKKKDEEKELKPIPQENKSDLKRQYEETSKDNDDQKRYKKISRIEEDEKSTDKENSPEEKIDDHSIQSVEMKTSKDSYKADTEDEIKDSSPEKEIKQASSKGSDDPKREESKMDVDEIKVVQQERKGRQLGSSSSSRSRSRSGSRRDRSSSNSSSSSDSSSTDSSGDENPVKKQIQGTVFMKDSQISSEQSPSSNRSVSPKSKTLTSSPVAKKITPSNSNESEKLSGSSSQMKLQASEAEEKSPSPPKKILVPRIKRSPETKEGTLAESYEKTGQEITKMAVETEKECGNAEKKEVKVEIELTTNEDLEFKPDSKEEMCLQEVETKENYVPKPLRRRSLRGTDEERKPVEENDEKKEKPIKKRKWGSSTKTTQKKSTSLEISTESLKGLICDVNPILTEPVLDLGGDNEVLSDKEEDKRDIKIRRTVVQVSLNEGRTVEEKTEEKEEKKMKTEESDEGEIKDIQPPKETKVIRRLNHQVIQEPEEPKAARRSPSPPRNPLSNIVHIYNLVRPFTLGQLKELLKRNGEMEDNGFWINNIKSHCIAVYKEKESAEEARKALHGTRWPPSNPKVLQVDYSTRQEFEQYRDSNETTDVLRHKPSQVTREREQVPEKERDREKERLHVGDRDKTDRDAKKKDAKPPIREWDRDKVRNRSRSRERIRGREKDRVERHRSKSADRERRKRSKEGKEKKEKKVEDEPPAKLLDDLFKKTKSTPCIYWLPLTEEQYQQRVEARKARQLEREKRRLEMEKEEELQRKQRLASGDSEKKKDKDRPQPSPKTKSHGRRSQSPRGKQKRPSPNRSRPNRSRQSRSRSRGRW